MSNKTITQALFISFGVVVLGVIMQNSGADDYSAITAIGGLGIWIFGIWAGVRLNKIDDKFNA